MTAPDFVTDGHLGGYIRGGDDATYYPDLWRWLVEDQGVRSVIDVGCGEGHALDFFRSLGCLVLGIDGIPQPDRIDVVRHDYTAGLLEVNAPPFDLAWCCEFVEHIEEQFIPNFTATLQCAHYVLMTHAEPEQPGWHHVNCQYGDYWIRKMQEHGFAFDPAMTEKTRALAVLNESPWNHYRRSGLAFVRSEPIAAPSKEG